MKHQYKPIIVLTVLVVALAGISIMFPHQTGDGAMKRFSSYSELSNFIESSVNSYYGETAVGKAFDMVTAGTTTSQSSPVSSDSSSRSEDYSATNIQVEGVDEPDIVKNDGKYIYTVSGRNVIIVDAYPAESATNVSQISFDGTPQELLVEGDRLVVIGYEDYSSSSIASDMGILPRYYSQRTFIDTFDITDRANPVLVRNVSVDGNYYDARMVGGYVYAIVNEPVYYGSTIPMPVIEVGSVMKTVSATDIYYFDVPDSSYVFTNIVSLSVADDSKDVNMKTYLTGYSEDMYVSTENIYIMYTKSLSETDYYDRIVEEAILPVVPMDIQLKIRTIMDTSSEYEKMQMIGQELQNYLATLGPEQAATAMKDIESRVESVYEDISKELEKTIINRISIVDGSIEYAAQGSVPGYVDDQFSIDEYNGLLRIATTSGSWRTQPANNVYVLDSSNLNILGSVEDLAKGERIYSARFMGDRAYLVTYKQVDPLFVLDMSTIEPKVLGYLKVNGVSEYLHPYDETHLIGIGRDGNDEGRTTGFKVSLFDISDVTNPTELSKYVINESGAYSDAQYDHKAFLFDRSKNLLVVPMSIYSYTEANGTYKYNYWQGAYVLNISLDGISLRGTVTHSSNDTYYDYSSQIRRSLYISDALWTVSSKMLKANSLSDLSFVNSVELPFEDYYYAYRSSVMPVAAEVKMA